MKERGHLGNQGVDGKTILKLIIALGYGLGSRVFESRQRLGISLFTTTPKPAPGPTQPPIPWGTKGSFPGGKADGA
jgi:hypothetical protein